jgi:predicted transcriptional regulator
MDQAVLGLTAQVVSGYVRKNRLSDEQLPDLIEAVYRTLSTVETAAAAAAARVEPVVEVKKSVFHNRIICLACGQGFSMLKRHLTTEHQLTPDAYRELYALPRSYPLVAPDYAKTRSALAKKIGLGHKKQAGRKRR